MVWRSILVLYLSLPALAFGQVTAVKSEWLITGMSDAPLQDRVVFVENNRIAEIGRAKDIEPDHHVIDLGPGTTILPGLIDSHVHLMIASDDYQIQHVQNSSSYKAIKALGAAQRLLNAGWTSIRVAGDADVGYGVFDVRRAIEEGEFEGPRIFGAGHYISITGGGGDLNFLSPETSVTADGLVADGVADLRKAVRKEVKYGSDWIKILATGAFMTAGDNPKDVHYSPEEMQVAVAEAKRLGVPVMAHAHSAAGVKLAVKAGARSIEHATFLDDEGLRLMKKHGTYLVPTIYVGDYYLEKYESSQAMAKMIALTKKFQGEYLENISKAISYGVLIAVGTDLGGYDDAHKNIRELQALENAGMSRMQAIQAATSVPAQMLGKESQIGSLAKGRLADLIAVRGRPDHDLSKLEKVEFVMKDGSIIKNEVTKGSDLQAHE